VLSVFSPSLTVIQHHLLAVDEEVSSYVVMGTEISFQSINELLVHYETNPINSTIGKIGTPYSRTNTREFNLKHKEMKKGDAQQELLEAKEQLEKAQQELERAKKNLSEHTKKNDAQMSITTDDAELSQVTEELKLISDKNNSNQERENYLKELEELKKANADLQLELKKSNSRHRGKCLMQ